MKRKQKPKVVLWIWRNKDWWVALFPFLLIPIFKLLHIVYTLHYGTVSSITLHALTVAAQASCEQTVHPSLKVQEHGPYTAWDLGFPIDWPSIEVEKKSIKIRDKIIASFLFSPCFFVWRRLPRAPFFCPEKKKSPKKSPPPTFFKGEGRVPTKKVGWIFLELQNTKTPRRGRAHAQAHASAVHGQNKCCSQHEPPDSHTATDGITRVNLMGDFEVKGGERYESKKTLNSPFQVFHKLKVSGFGTMSLHLFHSYFIYYMSTNPPKKNEEYKKPWIQPFPFLPSSPQQASPVVRSNNRLSKCRSPRPIRYPRTELNDVDNV